MCVWDRVTLVLITGYYRQIQKHFLGCLARVLLSVINQRPIGTRIQSLRHSHLTCQYQPCHHLNSEWLHQLSFFLVMTGGRHTGNEFGWHWKTKQGKAFTKTGERNTQHKQLHIWASTNNTTHAFHTWWPLLASHFNIPKFSVVAMVLCSISKFSFPIPP